MGQHKLSLDALKNLDGGKVQLAFSHGIQQCVHDIVDRPGDKAKRTATLICDLVPVLSAEEAVLDTIEVRFRVKSAVPIRRSSAYPMLPIEGGILIFQEHSPFDPRQNEFAYEVGKAHEEDQAAAAEAAVDGDDEEEEEVDL